MVFLGLVGLPLALPPVARAEPRVLASEEQLKKDFDGEKQRRFFKLSNGEEPYTKADEPTVKAGARWLVYRVGLPVYWNKKELQEAVKEYDFKVRSLVGGSSEAKVAKFREQFVKELIPCLQDALSSDLQENQPSVICAGIMLGALGHTGEEAAGTFLAKLAKEAKNDVVRLYAFKGLQEYFQARAAVVNDLAENEVRKKEIDRIEPLIEFLTAKAPVTDKSPPEELDAYRYVRREAIKALAETRVPAIPLLPKTGQKDGELKAPVAHTLLRVLSDGKEALSPTPSLSEKYEAAVGLARIRSKLVPRYRPDLAVAFIGKVVVEMGQTYNADWAHFGGKKEAAKVPLLPWRACAETLSQSLKDLKENTPPGDALKQAQELDKLSVPIFADMKRHAMANPGALTVLRDAVRQDTARKLERPDPHVYQNVPAYQIELRAGPG